MSCPLDGSSTLPHVHFASSSTLPAGSCTFTLAQARAGIAIAYDLVVDDDVPGFAPDVPYSYGADDANLAISEILSGGGQRYCVCDKGLPYRSCPDIDGGRTYTIDAGPCPAVTIPAGTYHRVFAWDGHNWSGPSDTFNPKGALFPAGDYELDLSTAPGTIGDAGDAGDAGVATATGRVTIHLVP
ncbi:MAG: hypothetical protein JOZ69_08225 [Myxococcales bacterium]|nr:hypothetical protein [Myxococcales bacterium]